MQKSSPTAWHLTTENRVTSLSNVPIRSSHELNCSTRSSLSAHHPTTSTRSIHTPRITSERKRGYASRTRATRRVFQRMQNARGNRVFPPPFQFSPCVSRVHFFVHFLSHAKRIGSWFTGPPYFRADRGRNRLVSGSSVHPIDLCVRFLRMNSKIICCENWNEEFRQIIRFTIYKAMKRLIYLIVIMNA